MLQVNGIREYHFLVPCFLPRYLVSGDQKYILVPPSNNKDIDTFIFIRVLQVIGNFLTARDSFLEVNYAGEASGKIRKPTR